MSVTPPLVKDRATFPAVMTNGSAVSVGRDSAPSGRRGALALVALLLLAMVVALPVFPTVNMTRSYGDWSGGDRIGWGVGTAPLSDVFRWSRSC